MDKVTPLFPERPQKRLCSVEWLVDRLGFKSSSQAYTAIRKGHIPSGCVVRIGRLVKINPEAVENWIVNGDENQEAN